MLITFTFIFLFLSSVLAYYFAGLKGAVGTFLTLLFLFGLPAIIYAVQST